MANSLLLYLGIFFAFLPVVLFLWNFASKTKKWGPKFEIRRLLELSQSSCTIAAIFISAYGILSNTQLTISQWNNQKESIELERRIKEEVYWKAVVVHKPLIPDMAIKIVCRKSKETIEPKFVTADIEVKYSQEIDDLRNESVFLRNYHIDLMMINERELYCNIESVQAIWSQFSNQKFNSVPIEEVLTKDVSVSMTLNYNRTYHVQGMTNVRIEKQERSEKVAEVRFDETCPEEGS